MSDTLLDDTTAPAPEGGPINEPLREFFVTRLRKMAELQRKSGRFTPQGRHLVSLAMFSTYLDCEALGDGERALNIVRGSVEQ